MGVKETIEKGNEAAFSSFIESIVPKVLPFVNPMMKGITDSFGDDEFIIVGKKNVKQNKVFIHIIKSKDVQKFEVAKITKVIEMSEFFQKALSGEVKQYFDDIKKEIEES